MSIILGRDTKVVREPATIEKIKAPKECRSPERTNFFLIQQTIHVSCVVTTTTDYPQAKCSRCDALAPQPDASVAEYILENHDGNRLLFPRAAHVLAAHPERDSYPLIGWTQSSSTLLCPPCTKELEAFLKGKRP